MQEDEADYIILFLSNVFHVFYHFMIRFVQNSDIRYVYIIYILYIL